VGVKAIALLMFFYGGFCLLLYQEDLVLVYNPLVLVLSVFIGHHLVDGLVYVTASVFLLRVQNWARSLAIGYSFIPLLQSSWVAVSGLFHPAAFAPGNFFVLQPYSMQGGSYEFALALTYVPLIMSCVFLWGLTRPQIRMQFSRERSRG
jgi:hypothetical protein